MQDANKRWVYCSILSGFVCGVGNFYMGIYLGNAGMMGPGLTGPLGLVLLLIYRGSQFCLNKKNHGSFINSQDSNWFTPEKKFKRQHLKALAGNFLPNLLGLVFLNLGFKYASMGGLN